MIDKGEPTINGKTIALTTLAFIVTILAAGTLNYLERREMEQTGIIATEDAEPVQVQPKERRSQGRLEWGMVGITRTQYAPSPRELICGDPVMYWPEDDAPPVCGLIARVDGKTCGYDSATDTFFEDDKPRGVEIDRGDIVPFVPGKKVAPMVGIAYPPGHPDCYEYDMAEHVTADVATNTFTITSESGDVLSPPEE